MICQWMSQRKQTNMETLLFIGIASYYSVAGCLGCSPTLTMANRERLNDSALTVALPPVEYRKYKNKYLLITNPKTGKKVKAKVTDSGGFAKYNRVADLSLATKNAIGCSNLCKVEIRK